MESPNKENSIPVEILDDLSSRFIINVPEEERKDMIRLCFQIELAHWFYLDFYCSTDPSPCNPCGMKEFCTQIFQHIPTLNPRVKDLDLVLAQWREYKLAVPTYGAILLDEEWTHVLLVQSYWAKASWGFPKGKVNEDEDPSHCAIREVLEETGYDISRLIDKSEYIESTVNEQLIRLYIIPGVPISTVFQPKTRNEIKKVEWFLLDDLPSSRKDMTPKVKMGVGPNAFFMVVPFIKRLKRWITEKQLKHCQPANRPPKPIEKDSINAKINAMVLFSTAVQRDYLESQENREIRPTYLITRSNRAYNRQRFGPRKQLFPGNQRRNGQNSADTNFKDNGAEIKYRAEENKKGVSPTIVQIATPLEEIDESQITDVPALPIPKFQIANSQAAVESIEKRDRPEEEKGDFNRSEKCRPWKTTWPAKSVPVERTDVSSEKNEERVRSEDEKEDFNQPEKFRPWKTTWPVKSVPVDKTEAFRGNNEKMDDEVRQEKDDDLTDSKTGEDEKEQGAKTTDCSTLPDTMDFVDYTPRAWKNFTFNQESVLNTFLCI